MSHSSRKTVKIKPEKLIFLGFHSHKNPFNRLLWSPHTLSSKPVVKKSAFTHLLEKTTKVRCDPKVDFRGCRVGKNGFKQWKV